MDEKLTIIHQKCFYQKFRYKTEKRSGRKTHDSYMLEIKFKKEAVPSSGTMQLFVFCVCADDSKTVHPNILLGKSNCSNGVYHMRQIERREKDRDGNLLLRIPYLYIVRTKNEEKMATVRTTCNNVPGNFGNMEDEDFYRNIKTDSVKLCIVLKVNDQYYSCVTNQISHHDGGENVALNIIRLSNCAFRADEGGETMIMTDDKYGPDIKAAEYEVYVETDQWTSKKYSLTEQDIFYKRVIIYKVPAYGGSDDGIDVKGKLVLRCITNNNNTSRDITYTACYIARKRKCLNDASEGNSKKPCHAQGKQIYEKMFSNSNYVASENIMDSTSESVDLKGGAEKCTSIADHQPLFLGNKYMNFQERVTIPQLTEDEDICITDNTTADDSDKKFYVNEAGGSFQSQPCIQTAELENGSSLRETLGLLDNNYVSDYLRLDSMDQKSVLTGITQFIEEK